MLKQLKPVKNFIRILFCGKIQKYGNIRKISGSTVAITSVILVSKSAVHGTHSWAAGLVKTLSDTKNHIISSNIGVVIDDKYPKAQHHYLVLPKDNIPSIFDLTQQHLPILEELHLLALNIIEIRGKTIEDFKLGFHAQPSMQRLHLHVISKDFVSESLKTKKHWNSFNTELFLPYEELFNEVKTQGAVKRLEKTEIKRLLAMDLKCNQCKFVAKNMPNLKEHLLDHIQKNKFKN